MHGLTYKFNSRKLKYTILANKSDSLNVTNCWHEVLFRNTPLQLAPQGLQRVINTQYTLLLN